MPFERAKLRWKWALKLTKKKLARSKLNKVKLNLVEMEETSDSEDLENNSSFQEVKKSETKSENIVQLHLDSEKVDRE